MAIIHPTKPDDSGGEGVPDTPGSSVTEIRGFLKGRKRSGHVYYPNTPEGKRIKEYLEGGSKDIEEIGDLLEAAYQKGYSESGLHTDTDKGLNFIIRCTNRSKGEYHIALRRTGGVYAA